VKFLAGFLAVLLVAVVQLYVAAPLGLALSMGPRSVAAAAFLGGMIGVVAIVFVGPRIMAWSTARLARILRRPVEDDEDDGKSGEAEPGRFAEMVDRFGAPFLGIVGPLTIGGWAAAAIGVGKGVNKLKLIAWLSVGQAIVTIAFVYTVAELAE
jgi:hypothetical protein